MKKIVPWISAISGSFIGWCIGKGIGEAMYNAYKDTGDMITASENISLHHVFPIACGIILGYLCYIFSKD